MRSECIQEFKKILYKKKEKEKKSTEVRLQF